MVCRTSISFPLLLPSLLLLLLAALGEVQAQEVVEVHLTDLLSGLLPLKGFTPSEIGGLRGALFTFGLGMLESAALIYFAKKKYRVMAEKAGAGDGGEDEDTDGDMMEEFLGGVMDAVEGIRQGPQVTRAPPTLPLVFQRSFHTQKRSIRAPPPSEDLWKLLGGLLQPKDKQEVAVNTVKLIQDVVERMEQNGCLLKLLCRLQEKPKGARTVEEEVLLSLYNLNAPKGSPECGQGSHKCFLKEALLEDAFSLLWGVKKGL